MIDNINECIEYLKEQSIFFYLIAKDKQKTYEEINKLKHSLDLNKLLECYKGEKGPLNILRFVVLNKIKEGIVITEDIVKEIKDKFNNKDLEYFKKYITQDILDFIAKYKTAKGEDPFKSWKDPFRIFYVYFFNLKKEQIESCLKKIGKKLIEDLNLTNYEIQLVNFDGFQSQGFDHCGLCLFPKELGEYKYAFQFSLDITNNQLFAGIYKGKEVITNKNFENNRNECFDYSTMLQTLKQYASQIIDLNNALIESKKQNQSLFEKGKQYWIYAPGGHAEKWDEYYNKNIMGIGWGFVGDIKNINNRKEIDKILNDNIKDSKNESHNNISKCLWDFANEMKVGDVVFVKKGVISIIGRGIVTGNYVYDDTIKDGFNHVREIEWTHNYEYKCKKEDKLLNKKTLTNITNSTKSVKILEDFFRQIEDKTSCKQGDKKMQPLNQILYGPPGTGKTYNTVIKAMEIIDKNKIKYDKNKNVLNYKEVEEEFNKLKQSKQIEFITFHQSYSYEEFIEGIKPDLENKEIKYKLEYGVLKKIVNKTTFDNIFDSFKKEHPDWTELKTNVDNSIFYIKYNNKSIEIYKDKENLTTTINCEVLENYFDLDFKYNFKTQTDLQKKLNTNSGLSYHFAILIELRKYIKPYILIIDEINRGNISKIFGEMITLIEEDKRIGNEHELKLTLPYSKEPFGIPNNLYIIGTMNTSDRSIASVDIALRRRFKFIEMMPKEDVVTNINIEENGKTFRDIFKALNEKITILLDRDHQIGHSYFLETKINDIYDLMNVWFDEILPLLNEYFYNDWEKLQALLGEASKNNDSFIVVKETKLPFYQYDIEDKVYDFIDKKNLNEENFKLALLKIIEEPKSKQKETDEQ